MNSQRPPTLIEQVRGVCRNLLKREPRWRALLKRHGMDIGVRVQDLARELERPLEIDRDVPGFEDFAQEGIRGIEPGKPARSLLYHALASPHVVTLDGERDLREFPTPEQIEVVENYVFGVRPPTVQDLRVHSDDAPLAIVVFTYEYRSAVGTVHQKHADMCFSRTGICRVGTRPCKYDACARAFVPRAKSDNQVRVLPSRYAAFVAAQYKGDKESFGPLNFYEKSKDIGGAETVPDTQLDFWVPLHKLFDGKECIHGFDIEIKLTAYHQNEKLRRIHLALAELGNPRQYSEAQLKEYPFVLTDNLASFSPPTGGWCHGLLTPEPHKHVVQAARLKGKRLTYKVPRNLGSNQHNASTFSIPADGNHRPAPEYVHARHKVDDEGHLHNLNLVADIDDVVAKGGYEAQHYLDFTADGWIKADCDALILDIPRTVSAYSLIAPPDFYPLAKQQDLMDWWKQSAPPDLAASIWPSFSGPPLALSDIRYPANLTSYKKHFEAQDRTITAIVAFRNSGFDKPTRVLPGKKGRVSTLPDRGAGVFDPGWDCSVDTAVVPAAKPEIEKQITHLAAYGLGSPFPEDGKLCAAESAFWPMASPDITRTFEPLETFAVTPLTDDFTGQQDRPSWDGIRGPQWPDHSKLELLFHGFAYGDWVESALRDEFLYGALMDTSARDYEIRTLVMARVYEALGAASIADKAHTSVFSFKHVIASDPEFKLAQSTTGVHLVREQAYRLIVFREPFERTSTIEVRFVRVRYRQVSDIFADPKNVLVCEQGGNWVAYES